MKRMYANLATFKIALGEIKGLNLTSTDRAIKIFYSILNHSQIQSAF